ncbi:hypothetical protein GKJPGBOP_07908 [Streptomyces paromomycinus]|uniref:Pvc16 N-terminal domain-containing protein n=2 Tax=Streptomyces paromomycinus TaxID=92743 RepID=A0A401WFM2_STREY|nr:hypothetical protein GKJPGBOP_07908 [Streptomyces paromomycinus]
MHEVDEVLKGLIGGGALAGSGIDVSFEVPTRDWAARRNAPVVNAYLYDAREDMARRQRGRTGLRDARDIVVRHRRPPRWFRLSCLVTAWTKTPQDEHRLLSAVLATLLPHELLAAEELPDSLGHLGPDRHFCNRCAMPPAESATAPAPGRRPWWRRLFGPGGQETPWAGDRPRLRRAFDRVGTWITPAVAVPLVIFGVLHLPDGRGGAVGPGRVGGDAVLPSGAAARRRHHAGDVHPRRSARPVRPAAPDHGDDHGPGRRDHDP